MHFVDLIQKKKEGLSFTQEELHYFIDGYVRGIIPDYQVSALLMAICFQSMNKQETAWLCKEMLESGKQVDLSDCGGVICDKHSTGGVGDKTSLAFGPMIAACGVKMAKMSGRGLGHTGGTLDKLEAIPGFQTSLDERSFIKQVQDIGIAIISQSKTLVPADKMLYALRDVTATVDSIPLIASSIMSKKLACGADCILLDVKYGEGAFMKDAESAAALAKEMIDIGSYFHKDTKAIISNMNEPLGNAIGNALEVEEAILTLQGKGPEDFMELCMQAGCILLQQAKAAASEKEARTMLRNAVASGAALQKFKDMVAAQHGDVRIIDDFSKLPQASYQIPIPSLREGYVHELHAKELGTLAMHLGAGRVTKDDMIDPAVGIVLNKKTGAYVKKDEIIATVHANSPLSENWVQAFYACFELQPQPKKKIKLIEDIVC